MNNVYRTGIRIYLLLLHIREGGGAENTALQVGRSRVRFPIVSLEFFIDMYFLGVKAAVPTAGTLPLSCEYCPKMQ
jgi:hypothetical protein